MPGAGGPKLSVGDALGYGWKGFTNNVGPFLLIALVLVGVGFVFMVLGWIVQDSWFLTVILRIISWLVQILLALGVIRAALAVVNGQKPAPEMLFQGNGFGTYLAASILVSIGVFLGLIACIIPGLILAFMWQFFGYSIADGETADPIEAMKRSWRLVAQNVGPLLLLILAAIALNFVGAILCLIGLLVTIPWTGVAYAYAWRSLTTQRIAPLP